ncbi:MAG: terminase small subunit [Patescibacteria group bacterium]|nr:terminase small subunit [Patescibacteria group bacterium]
MPNKKCPVCHKNFYAKTANKVYCTKSCKKKKSYIVEKEKTQEEVGSVSMRLSHHSSRELKAALLDYFGKEKENASPAGMLLHLDITRKRWNVYESKPNLAYVCEWAQLMMEKFGTERLYDKGRVADIFFMKNMGWSDKQEVATKETIVIGQNINDEQAKNILERFEHRRRLAAKSERQSGRVSVDSKTIQK